MSTMIRMELITYHYSLITNFTIFANLKQPTNTDTDLRQNSPALRGRGRGFSCRNGRRHTDRTEADSIT